MTGATPSHLVAKVGDKRSLCGVKNPLPYGLVSNAKNHRYPHDRCPTCYEAAGLGWMLAYDDGKEAGE